MWHLSSSIPQLSVEDLVTLYKGLYPNFRFWLQYIFWYISTETTCRAFSHCLKHKLFLQNFNSILPITYPLLFLVSTLKWSIIVHHERNNFFSKFLNRIIFIRILKFVNLCNRFFTSIMPGIDDILFSVLCFDIGDILLHMDETSSWQEVS